MAFERDINSEPIKYADKHFPKCPFCQTVIPDWSVEVNVLTSRTKKYIYMCHECEGIFEITSTSSKDFKENTFSEVIMGNVGRGQYNYNMRGKETDIATLCDMCGYDLNKDYEEPEIVVAAGRSDLAAGGRTDVTRRSGASTSGSSTTRRSTTTSGTSTTRRSTSGSSSSTRRTTTSSGSSSTRRTTTSSGSSTTRRSTTSSGSRRTTTRARRRGPIGIIGFSIGAFSFFLQLIGFIKCTSGNSSDGMGMLISAMVLSIPGLILSVVGNRLGRNPLMSIFGIIVSGLAMMLSFVMFICYI